MKLVYGVGVNDADYIINPTVDGKPKMCTFYRKWHSMLTRCYSEKYQERCPTYKGCSVAEEWLTFSKFRLWMVKQDWKGNDLDKDLLLEGNKKYGPKTCVFICRALNLLLTDRGNARGSLPLGTVKHGKKYRAQVGKGGKDGKTIYLGLFTTPEEAHAAWKKAKAKIILNSLDLTNDIRVKDALVKRAQVLV